MAAMISNLMCIGSVIIFNFCVDTDFQRYDCFDIKFYVRGSANIFIFCKDRTAVISNLMCIGSAIIFNFCIDIDFPKMWLL
jgi:heme O synthase-like polyprenyltransferase